MRTSLFASLLVLTACYGDETVRAYGAQNATWQLTELNGAAFAASATLTFPEPGQIAGNAPCNRYGGKMDRPYPWFKTGPLRSTKRACPHLQQETSFFKALESATFVEVSGPILILSNEDGLQMVFKAVD